MSDIDQNNLPDFGQKQTVSFCTRIFRIEIPRSRASGYVLLEFRWVWLRSVAAGMLNGYGTHLAQAFWMNALQLFALQQNATLYEYKNSKEISYGPAQKQFN